MIWNIRLVDMSDEDDPYIEAREVYYNQDGSLIGHCPAGVGGENIEEIKQYIQWITEALDKPVLKFDKEEESNDD